VSNIRDSHYPLSISTNGGEMNSHQKWDIPHIKDVWCNENSITDIISMRDMTRNFCVTMDSKEELSLLVHMPNKIVKFKQFSVTVDMHSCTRPQVLLQALNQALPTQMIAILLALLRLMWGVWNVSIACCLLQHAG
jgi:hypothetical protein